MRPFRHIKNKAGTRLYIPLLLSLGVCLFVLLLPGCTADGLRLISQLEARELKDDALSKREMCFEEFVDQDKFEECYREEVFLLVADECVSIRATEPITQKDCEDFLYRVVMKPDSFFPEYAGAPEDEGYEGFPEEYRSDNLHPIARQGGCETSQACRDKCRSIFGTLTEKEHCFEYSTSAAQRMETVFTRLQNPSLSNLRALKTNEYLRSLQILLAIGVSTVITTLSTGDTAWDAAEKKIILSWLAESPDVVKIFKRADSDFLLLTNVVEGNTATDTVANLNKGLGSTDTGDNFIDKLLEKKNEGGLKWLHDYVKAECDSDGTITNSEKRCIFENYYCEFNLHNNNELKFFEYEFFTDLLDNILEFQRKSSGAPSWWDSDTRSVDLDPDQWQNGVCDNLI